MLNYLYALLEAETRFACLACGLDPGLGVFHADQKSRDSLVLDLMEAVRPQVDAYLLDLLAARTFSAKDFVETRKGVCRVLAPLTHTLAETTTQWARAIAPVVENVAAMLAVKSRSRIERLPTPLTQANRSSGRDAVRRKPRRPKSARARKPTATCATCGGPLPNSDAAILRRLPARRTSTSWRKFAASAGQPRLPRCARRVATRWESDGGAAQDRRGQRAATPRGNRVGSNPRETGPGGIHARDTAAASRACRCRR